MTEHEAREGMGGATEYQVREAGQAYPMEEGVDHELSKALENLLAAQGE